jgi:leader peptidase (prepilin peptidase)/N-methyltransferase
LDRLLECALFVVGLAFGSFLNVCISRIPYDESVVSPRSHCPNCGAPIRWFDNIPVVSWLLLGARCRDCHARIRFRYPAVEILTALLFVACYAEFGWTWLTLKFLVFSFLLVGLIFMDAETGILAREFTYPGILLGLLFSWIAGVDSSGTRFLFQLYSRHWESARTLSLLDALLGAIVGAGFFYLAWALYYLIRRKHGIGFGDIALMAMSGAFLGLKLVLLVIFFAPLVTVLYALVVLLSEAFGFSAAGAAAQEDNALAHGEPLMTRQFPFGVFLGGCSLAATFFGQAIWEWYLGRF